MYWHSISSHITPTVVLQEFQYSMELKIFQALDSTCKALVENLPDGVCYSDADGVIICANRSFASLLGVSSLNTLVDQFLFSFIHQDHHMLVQSFFEGIPQRNHSLAAIQVQSINNDDVQHWLEIRWIDIPTDGGIFLVVHDLASYKTSQDELLLQALTDELTDLFK